MRRKDKQITDRSTLDYIIRNSLVCRLATASQNIPYIIPVSFGYDGQSLFIHTAKKGKKIDNFLNNNTVCFEFENNVRLHKDDKKACSWTFEYESVIGYGQIEELLNPEDKICALNQIMQQYSGQSWAFKPAELETIRIWRISINSLSGKRSERK